MKLRTQGVRPTAQITALVAAVALMAACSGQSAASSSPSGSGGAITIGIVEQQLTNPFFSKLQEAAVAAAKKSGAEVMTAESKTAGDAASQVAAVENMIARGVKGIVLDPANASALAAISQKARDAGILVVTVNTSLDPLNASDASYETDNLAGGTLIGQWAKATLGASAAQVAMLDYDLSDKTAKARHDGFLAGFGITDSSPEIAGTALTKSNFDTGQTAMENLLSAHGDINVVYAINEPAAQGAYKAITDKGLAGKVIVTGIDGSCAGVRAVASGEIGATVMQFPTRMGEMAVAAILDYAKSGAKPAGVINSGTVLITDAPVDGVKSETTSWGLTNCWGE